MVLPITFTETWRNRLGVVSAVLCIVMSLMGLCLIGIGIYVQITINDRLLLLNDYNDGLLPNFLIAVGTLMFIINGITTKFAYDTGFAETRDKFRLALTPVMLVMAVYSVVVLAASITTYAHRNTIEESLHGGLTGAMKRYKDNLNVKVTIDKLQIESRCCGSKSYKDWFKTGWINPEFVDKIKFEKYMKDGDILTENVPFSCCDASMLRPCVTVDVLNFKMRKNYEKLTLYKEGCTTALADLFEKRIIQPVGTFILILFGLQVFLVCLIRYLQTSAMDAMLEGDPEGPGKGYVIPNPLQACTTGDPMKYVQQGALDKMRGKRTDKTNPAENDDTVVDMDDDEDDASDGDYGGGGGGYGMDDMDIGDFGGGGGGGGGGPDDGGGGGSGGGGEKGKDKKDKKDKKNDKKKDKKGDKKKDKKGDKKKDKKKKSNDKKKQKKKPANKKKKGGKGGKRKKK